MTRNLGVSLLVWIGLVFVAVGYEIERLGARLQTLAYRCADVAHAVNEAPPIVLTRIDWGDCGHTELPIWSGNAEAAFQEGGE